MLTVEVIEDDLAMRALLLEWLADAGYRVHVGDRAGTASTATFDVVVFDLPNLRVQGAEIIHDVQRRYAGAALVGLSTQVVEATAGGSRQARALGLDQLVPKPSSRQALLSAVARAIARAD
jgi:CheY-like chemotaxis protein